MISVILPTYNGEKFLSKSIESIIRQTYENWELIIIDDCSKDRTAEIANDYVKRDSRIRYFRNEKNLKLPASLNRGFSLANGEYLTWTSDDNVFLPKAFESMVGYLQNHAEMGLVFTRQEIIDENDNSLRLLDVVDNIDDLYFRDIIEACFMYTREVYETVGDYDTNKFLAEDWDYWLRIYRNFKIGYIKDILYQYRTHGGSLTETRNVEAQKAAIDLFEETLEKNVDLSGYVKSNLYISIIYKSFSTNQFGKLKLYCKKLSEEYEEQFSQLELRYRVAYLLPENMTKQIRNIARKLKAHKK